MNEWAFQYNGKEKELEFGLAWNDHGSRNLDLQLGRWHGVDPQGEKRPHHSPYMAMGNNPISNYDPDGEFFLGTMTAIPSGLVRGITRAVNGDGLGGFFQGFGEGVWNGIKIDAGMFAWDRNLTPAENVLSVLSRFTWEFPQTFGGNLYNALHNTTGQVDWVRYQNGATVVSSRIQPGGIALGNYITGRAGRIEADVNNELFQHEYGHVLQSRAFGWAYIPRVGVPSIADLEFLGEPFGDHSLHPVEQDANARAFFYFHENVPGFYEAPGVFSNNDGRGWDFNQNPVAGNNVYLNFFNLADRRMIRNSRIRTAWYDYLFPVHAAIYNAFILYNP